jgi:hypothetical protein
LIDDEKYYVLLRKICYLRYIFVRMQDQVLGASFLVHATKKGCMCINMLHTVSAASKTPLLDLLYSELWQK